MKVLNIAIASILLVVGNLSLASAKWAKADASDYQYMQKTIDFTLSHGKCRQAPFGASIVRKRTGEVLCYGINLGNHNPTWHGEIRAFNNCSDIYPGNGINYDFWKELTMYTTGEPCAMCQGAIMFSRLGRMVYASSIATITKYGRGQIQIPSWEITNRSPKEHFVDTEIVPNVLREQTDEWFKWQFDPQAPCPSGCQRQNGTCTDI